MPHMHLHERYREQICGCQGQGEFRVGVLTAYEYVFLPRMINYFMTLRIVHFKHVNCMFCDIYEKIKTNQECDKH